jgi:hypothetical protein
MGCMTCTEPQRLYKGALYLYLTFAFPLPKKLLVYNHAFYKFPTAGTFQLITKAEKMLTLTVEQNSIKLKQESPNFTKLSKISLKM